MMTSVSIMPGKSSKGKRLRGEMMPTIVLVMNRSLRGAVATLLVKKLSPRGRKWASHLLSAPLTTSMTDLSRTWWWQSSRHQERRAVRVSAMLCGIRAASSATTDRKCQEYSRAIEWE